MTRVLVTGAGGFAGAHFLEAVLMDKWWNIIATDSFRHKGKIERITEVSHGYPVMMRHDAAGDTSVSERLTVLTHDLNVPFSNQEIEKMGEIDYIVAYASESHVDRSISDPVPFAKNNVNVALSTLELARKVKPQALIWVSTDEVYGPVEADDLKGHKEWAPILPSNPYAASKAAQEALCISYWRTYGVPLVIVNCFNMFGERQDCEKFVPLVLGKVLAGEEVAIHGTPDHIGTRYYLHARNLADGILFLLQNPALHDQPFKAGFSRPPRYNIVSPDRVDNLAMAQLIADYANKELKYRFEDFHATRPGHDPHYGLDGQKMQALGWDLPVPFRDSLRRTVLWTLDHPSWLLED